jgi:hypothetical protein
LFLFVRSHQQLQQYCMVAGTQSAANESDAVLRGADESRQYCNVVDIHAIERSSSAR